MNHLINVSIRQNAVFVPQNVLVAAHNDLKATTSVLVANLAQLGFGLSERLLIALNRTNPAFQANLLDKFKEVVGVNKNWTPLVKAWDNPTGESISDHIMTFFASIFQGEGTELACGHIIPPHTFPLERYNGCPFCGTPFEFGKLENYGQGSKLKILDLWNENDLYNFFSDLLTSKTALDATQIDSLKILLAELPLPDVEIGIKETLMTVIDTFLKKDNPEIVQKFFKSPTDILRFLWYKKTGFLQIIEPKTIVKRKKANSEQLTPFISLKSLQEIKRENKSYTQKVIIDAQKALKLKYDRKTCRIVATWLNNLEISTTQIAEIMHPKRQMWVRFIRALRLAEYSKKAGFEKLKELLDIFYHQKYEVWQGKVDAFRLKTDQENTFRLLKQRAGLFARSLFANMLWFGKDAAIEAFTEVIDKVPARLLFTLNSYAALYFDKTGNRSVKPLGGVNKRIPKNHLLNLYTETQLQEMQTAITDLCLLAMRKRFSAIPNDNKTIYIAPILYKMPVAIGDRSDNIQDLPAALTGSRFELLGNKIRLFMQWGTGLAAQHLDMDLSCTVSFPNKTERCYFGTLTTIGCKHSGDIRHIPDKIGTAEYIEIDLDELTKHHATYVTFACNAYSSGAITPNLVVGWMSSEKPMKISETTGVAYDPSCVQHQVRITNSLTKGLCFGVLEVQKREIVWIEMPFSGQIVHNLDEKNVKAMLEKLDAKLSIGNLLALKAEAQNLQIVDNQEDAHEKYDYQWGINSAAVTKLLVD